MQVIYLGVIQENASTVGKGGREVKVASLGAFSKAMLWTRGALEDHIIPPRGKEAGGFI